MTVCRSCWSCCSFLLLLGFSQPLIIQTPQDSVNGTVRGSVLLSVSYRLKEPLRQPLIIVWNFSCTTDALAASTWNNCSVNAEGIPTNCSVSYYVHPAYSHRAILFLDNASLLLQNLMLNDSGDYSVSVSSGQGKQIKYITLTVSEPQTNNGNADYGNQATDHDVFYIAGGSSCSILLFLLLLFYYRWQRGMARQKIRIIKQQEAMNPDDLHMGSVLSRSRSAIYASVGEDIGQGQPASELHVEYASISFPHYQ